MAPGLIYSLPQDELREALHNERAAASSTTPPSCQASKTSNAVEIESPVQKMASPGADAQATTTQDTEKVLLLESGFVEQLKKTLDFSAVQNRQLDELLNTCQVTTKPLLARAYSESSLPPKTCDAGSPPAEETTKKDARYQATVEDCTESEDEEETPAPSCVPKTTPTAELPCQDTESHNDRPRRRYTFPASAPTSPMAAPVLTTAASAPVAVPVVKEVRFSDRVPTVLPRTGPVRHTTWSGSTFPQANMHMPRQNTHLDERWGVLFKPQGRATTRMRNVLRGLAIYLTEVYKPTYSLVLTPEKLYRFYSRYRLDREPVDFTRIFGLTSRVAMWKLEDLYSAMKCEYHLVQENSPDSKEPHCIPALTPEGFVTWTLKLIRAYPDQEASRLARVIADVPLDAVAEDPAVECDDQPSRLPRQISRHLFPAEADPDVLQLVALAIRDMKQDRLPLPPLPPPTPAMQMAPPPPPPPLIHSDARSRQDHLNRCRRDYESGEAEIVVPGSSKRRSSSPERDGGRSSRYSARPHARQESPPRRGSKRYNRRETNKDSDRDRRRGGGDRRWSDDGYEDSRYRRRDGRGSRS